jgi:hypothetical protein
MTFKNLSIFFFLFCLSIILTHGISIHSQSPFFNITIISPLTYFAVLPPLFALQVATLHTICCLHSQHPIQAFYTPLVNPSQANSFDVTKTKAIEIQNQMIFLNHGIVSVRNKRRYFFIFKHIKWEYWWFIFIDLNCPNFFTRKAKKNLNWCKINIFAKTKIKIYFIAHKIGCPQLMVNPYINFYIIHSCAN